MYNHAPAAYNCPFCMVVQGIKHADLLTRPSDIISQTDQITAFISSHQWPNNKGHVLIISNARYENVYDLPIRYATATHAAVQIIVLAMKAAYGCDGISTRQHNEPAGNQDVWHYQMHVFPRYEADGLYGSERIFMPPEERAAFAKERQLNKYAFLRCCDTAMPTLPCIAASLMQLLRAPWTGAISLPHKCRAYLITVPKVLKNQLDRAERWAHGRAFESIPPFHPISSLVPQEAICMIRDITISRRCS
jgi:histidine triad (HIT) family protein